MSRTPEASRNLRLAGVCAAVFAVMVGVAFAAVPFYRAFCSATGFDGAVKRASFAPGATAGEVTVRFDANVNRLDWKFEPVRSTQVVRLGQPTLAYFKATNLSDRPLTGRALFNVTPEAAGQYFNKIQCFCFNNQTLAPGQTAQFPVVFYVDPAYGKDRDTRYQSEITLSYTFFPAQALGSRAPEARPAPAAASPLGGGAAARL